MARNIRHEFVNMSASPSAKDPYTAASARPEYANVIDRLAAQGCDAVALVCTTIPLLVPPDASPLPVLDSTRLLARAAFDVATGRRPVPT